MPYRSARPFLLAALMALLIVACGGPTAPQGPTSLIGDEDLAAAEVIELIDLDVAVTRASARFDLRLDDLQSRTTMQRGVRALPHQEEEPEPGHIAAVEVREATETEAAEYRILLYEDTEALSEGELVFMGSTEVESVAVDLEGELMLFSAGSEEDGLEVYVLDIAGVIGDPETVYRIPGTEEDETDVAMSLDGNTWVYSTVVEGKRGGHQLFLDRAAREVSFTRILIQLGDTPIDVYQPSLSGDGQTWVVHTDDPLILDAIGAPVVITGTAEDCCGTPYVGVTGSTTSIKDPSLSEDGAMLLIEEVFDGVEVILLVDPLAGTFDELVTNEEPDEIIDHPHLTAGGDGMVYALDGVVHRAEITVGEEGTTADSTPVAASDDGFIGFAPYIARAAPPPPPPPPGTIEYSGTLVGADTWNRPEPPAPGTYGPMGYHAFEFTADDTGFYTIESEQDYDGYLLLYAAPFDPADPYANLLDLNDDAPSAGRSEIRALLEPGDYVVVTTSCGPEGSPVCGDHEGDFENRIIPPQIPGPEEPPVIELFNADISVLDIGEAVTVTWFAESSLPITCSIDWGDGDVENVPCEAGTMETASHSYDTEGPKVITLTISNSNGSVTAKAFPTVHTNDPSNFDIVVVFANDLLSPTQMEAFQGAADRWAEVITGDVGDVAAVDLPANFSCIGEPGFNGEIDDLVISAAGQVIDGPSGVLARAGPCLFRQGGTNGELAPLPVYGIMEFDIADLDVLEDEGGLFSTILHEMGHVLGIGTLWNLNELISYEPSDAACREVETYTSAPVFTGEKATAEFQALGGEGNPPVENEFGAGTRCSHWDEETFTIELMTGFLDTGVELEPLSTMTVGSLEDVGYEVDYAAADPYEIPTGEARLAPSATRGYDIAGIFGKHWHLRY